MEKKKIRLLRADEIECRIAVINENGLSLLLYKDARVDQKILDETFGTFGWQRSHQCIDGNLYCTVEVYDEESGTWVAKQDVGTTSFAEKEKSQASDSFKRACFNWGIGRELYTAPFIWIPTDKADIKKKDNKYYCNDHFNVVSIGYNSYREITELKIVGGQGKMVYELKAKDTEKSIGKAANKDREEKDYETKGIVQKEPKEKKLSKGQMDSLKSELERTGVSMETVQDRYHIQKAETMSEELYNKVMSALFKTKSASAA